MTREPSHKSGRYSHAGGLASIDLPREGKRAGGKIEIVHGVAPDPYFAKYGERRGRGKFEVLGQRQQRVAINRRADAIEFELSCGRISQAAADAILPLHQHSCPVEPAGYRRVVVAATTTLLPS